MRPSSNELKSIRNRAAKVGLEVTYDPMYGFGQPWRVVRLSTGFVWFCQRVDRVLFAITNEVKRAKRIVRVVTRGD